MCNCIPQFNVYGKDRRALKKKLSCLKREVIYWNNNWQINDDLYKFYCHDNPFPKEDMEEHCIEISKEIEDIETSLSEPYTETV